MSDNEYIKAAETPAKEKKSDSKKLNDAYKVDAMGEYLTGAASVWYDEQFQLYNEDNLLSWNELSAKFVE